MEDRFQIEGEAVECPGIGVEDRPSMNVHTVEDGTQIEGWTVENPG